MSEVPRTVTEYAIMLRGMLVYGPADNDRWNEGMTLHEAAALWYPGAVAVTRTRTIYPDALTDWTTTPPPNPSTTEGETA